MPLYEYKCNSCEHIFEEFQSINDEPIKNCPLCNSSVKKIISLNSSQLGIGDPKEYYDRVIKPEAKKIADKIRSGDEDVAADIFGSGEK